MYAINHWYFTFDLEINFWNNHSFLHKFTITNTQSVVSWTIPQQCTCILREQIIVVQCYCFGNTTWLTLWTWGRSTWPRWASLIGTPDWSVWSHYSEDRWCGPAIRSNQRQRKSPQAA
jgi:hypothetical protein